MLEAIKIKAGLLVWNIVVLSTAVLIAMIGAGNTFWASGKSYDKHHDILKVSNKLSPNNFLPYRYIHEIGGLEDVRSVTDYSSAAVVVPEFTQIALMLIVDKNAILDPDFELDLVDVNQEEWLEGDQAVLVSKAVYDELKHRINDYVPIKVFASGEHNRNISIAGAFNDFGLYDCEVCIIAGRDFANKYLPGYAGLVSSFFVIPDEQGNAVELATLIDKTFENEMYPTNSQAADEAAQTFLREFVEFREALISALSLVFISVNVMPILTLVYLLKYFRRELTIVYDSGFSRYTITARIVQFLLAYLLVALIISCGLGFLISEYVGNELPWVAIHSFATALTVGISLLLLQLVLSAGIVAHAISGIDLRDIDTLHFRH